MKLSISTSCLPTCLLLTAIAFAAPIGGTVVSNTTELKEGIFRYHYESNITSCSVISFIGVGTAMRVEDYDLLAMEMATARPGLIAGFIDHAPRNPIKVSEEKFSKLVEALVDRIHDYVPVCGGRDKSTGTKDRQPRYVIGGHSASGGAAMRSLPSLKFAVLGFVGLSPFRITDDMYHINIPALFWGFSTETCGVVVKYAADQAYSLSSPEHGRVLYQLQNPSGQPSHCIFANHGCLPICPTSNPKDFEWICPAVAHSVRKFLVAIETNTFTRDSLRLQLPENVASHDLKMLVNQDSISPDILDLVAF